MVMLCRFLRIFCIKSINTIECDELFFGEQYPVKICCLYKNYVKIFLGFEALLLTGEAPRTIRCARRRLVCPSHRDNPHSNGSSSRQFPIISRALRVTSGPGWHHQHHHHHPASSAAVSPPPPPLQDASALPLPPLASQPRRCAL